MRSVTKEVNDKTRQRKTWGKRKKDIKKQEMDKREMKKIGKKEKTEREMKKR